MFFFHFLSCVVFVVRIVSGFSDIGNYHITDQPKCLIFRHNHVNNSLQIVLKHLKLYILTQKAWEINYYIAEKIFSQYLQPNKQNSIDFMNGLAILAMWKGWRKLKSWVEMNVLCIVDQDHQWWVIAADHTSKFKVI